MTRRVLCMFLIIVLLPVASMAWANPELSFFLGKKDGSDNSDGVTVRVIIEEEKGKETEVFNEHWKELAWSDKFAVDLRRWGGKAITLNITTDPGLARNTGWDWILIGDAKVTDNGQLVYDIGQAVATGKVDLSMLLDGDKNETPGLGFGANCSPDGGTCGGQTMPKSFMQHPPWDGRVGNTIARHEIELTAAIESDGKLAITWGLLKTY